MKVPGDYRTGFIPIFVATKFAGIVIATVTDVDAIRVLFFFFGIFPMIVGSNDLR